MTLATSSHLSTAVSDDLEDFFPLDDLDGIFLFIEKLGDERAGRGDRTSQRLISMQCLSAFAAFPAREDGNLDLGRWPKPGLDEIEGSLRMLSTRRAQIGWQRASIRSDHVVQTAAEFVNVFTVKGGDEGLVRLVKGVGISSHRG